METGFGDPDDELRQELPYQPRGLLVDPSGRRFRLAEFNPEQDVVSLANEVECRSIGSLILSNN